MSIPGCPMPTDQPKLRWYQFSLRTLLIFITLFACACSWFAVKMQEAERQRKIRQAIEKHGGGSIYDIHLEANERSRDNKFDSKAFDLATRPCSDFSNNATEVHLGGSLTLTDSDLAQLAELKHLRKLELYRTQVTDAGLKHLTGLKELKFLDLRDTKVTDAGVARLKKALPKCWIRHGTYSPY